MPIFVCFKKSLQAILLLLYYICIRKGIVWRFYSFFVTFRSEKEEKSQDKNLIFYHRYISGLRFCILYVNKIRHTGDMIQ